MSAARRRRDLGLPTAVTSLRWEGIPIDNNYFTLPCDTSAGHVRPLVPTSLRCKVFDTVHGLSHSGANTTVKLVSSKFVWHGLSKQVRAWNKTCLDCQRAKVHHHIRASLETFVIPPRWFDHVHVDIVKPLPPSQGYTYLLTVVDRFMENTLLEKFGKACKDNTEIYSIPQKKLGIGCSFEFPTK